MLLDNFHFTGCDGKDVSLGLQRFNQLVNVTKVKDYSTSGCTIHFNNKKINENAKLITLLEQENQNSHLDPIKKQLNDENIIKAKNLHY